VVTILGWIVAVLQGLAAATAVVLWRAVDGLRRRGARRLAPLPSLIVVRPIRGLDPGLAANVRAALAQRYPGALETIFVLDDTSDPAYPVVRRLVDASSARARVVIAGPIPPGRTGKLHAMIEGLRAARLDARLVGFADSDTRPAPTLLAELARAVVAQPDVGAAFAPAVTVSRPLIVGDVGHVLRLLHELVEGDGKTPGIQSIGSRTPCRARARRTGSRPDRRSSRAPCAAATLSPAIVGDGTSRVAS
jgi:ceramide glucosyltransferase